MINKVSNNTNFGSKPLHKVNLKSDLTKGFVPAVLSELKPKDEKDLQILEKINKNWENAPFLAEILNSFKNPSDNIFKKPPLFYALELPEKPLHEKIAGLINIFFDKKNLDLAWVQANPKLEYKDKSAKREIKGIGEILIGKAFSVANNLNTPLVSLTEVNDKFFEKTFKKGHIKTFNDESGYFTFIKQKYFNNYLKYIQKKYKTTF